VNCDLLAPCALVDRRITIHMVSFTFRKKWSTAVGRISSQ
jgi:hypothetical protein